MSKFCLFIDPESFLECGHEDIHISGAFAVEYSLWQLGGALLCGPCPHQFQVFFMCSGNAFPL